jgi:succinylarginine dihydrolase
VLFPRQHPAGIDGGAFHTDVLAVGYGRILLLHELAFADAAGLVAKLRSLLGDELQVLLASDAELPLAEAVASYAFNSQLLELPDGTIALLAPEESRENPRARAFLERAASAGGPVARVFYRNVRESMNNGGGPACLRLRVALTAEEVGAIRPRVLFSGELHAELGAWIARHYRDRLVPDDLRDPALAREGMAALDELTRILGLGSVYDFQR